MTADREDKKYQMTKEMCNSMILKEGVCPYCGNKIEPIETVDNSNNPTYWAGCLSCNRFTNGVEKEVYDLSKKLIDNDYQVNYNDDKTYMISQMVGVVRKVKAQAIKEYKDKMLGLANILARELTEEGIKTIIRDNLK